MASFTESPRLTARYADALGYAFELHRLQVRKGADATPYVSHLLAVSALVLEHGGSEDEAIGALLHDAAEDQGGSATLAAIRLRFGDAVADIVDGCSDSMAETPEAKAPWRERKVKYLDHFGGALPAVRLVSMADKLHNCRSTVGDLHTLGAATWLRFNASREDQLWFYRTFVELAKNFEAGAAQPRLRLVAELDRAVAELERLA